MPTSPPWLTALRRRLGTVTLATLGSIVAAQLVFGIGVNLAGSSVLFDLYAEGLALSPAALAAGRVWTLLTYALVHDLADPFHVLFNGLALFYFMPPFEKRRTVWPTLRLLLASVACGGLLQMGWQGIAEPFLAAPPAQRTVGISAAVVAFLAAFGWAQPTARVQLMFVVPLEARWLAPLGLGVDFLIFVSGRPVAFFAHLGGYLAAWFLIWGRGDPQFIWRRLRFGRPNRFVVVN